MKSLHALPPLFALAIVGSTLVIQRRALAILEHDNGRLPRHAVPPAVADSGAVLFPELEKRHSTQTAKADGPFNWRDLAVLMESRNNGQGDSRALASFEKRVKAMNNEELIANIEEIMNLDLAEDQRYYLFNDFFDALIDRDPELALRRLFGRSSQADQSLASAWEKWSTSNPGAATVWLDEQIAAGKSDPKRLDGSDGCRGDFEGHLVKLLLASDPAAATRRMENLNPDLRDDVIRQCVDSNADAPTRKAWADLVRSQLPGKDALETIASNGPHWLGDGNFSKVMDYMETISATPAERTACIQQAIERYTRETSFDGITTIEGIESLRAWADGQESGLTRNLTRDAIRAMLSNNEQSAMTLESVKTITAHYQTMEGGDEILVQALEKSMNPNYKMDYLSALAAMIQDDGKRAEILKKLETR